MDNNIKALAYQHIFADGSKYFGNALHDSRPFDFKNRNDRWLATYAKYGAPVVQIRRNLTTIKADEIERWLFDRYVASGGRCLQARPSGKHLSTVVRNRGRKHLEATKEKISQRHKGRKHSAQSKENMSKGRDGLTLSDSHKTNIRFSMLGVMPTANKRIISSLDGRITTHAQSGHWNKKNPAYIGTWSDYIEE